MDSDRCGHHAPPQEWDIAGTCAGGCQHLSVFDHGKVAMNRRDDGLNYLKIVFNEVASIPGFPFHIHHLWLYCKRTINSCQETQNDRKINTNYTLPTGNLDSKSCRAVIDAFLKARDTMQATIFMVTHDSYAASFCDRVVVLKDGQVNGILENRGNRRVFMDELLDTIRVLGGELNDNE